MLGLKVPLCELLDRTPLGLLQDAFLGEKLQGRANSIPFRDLLISYYMESPRSDVGRQLSENGGKSSTIEFAMELLLRCDKWQSFKVMSDSGGDAEATDCRRFPSAPLELLSVPNISPLDVEDITILSA